MSTAAGCSLRQEWHRRTAAFDPQYVYCTTEERQRPVVAFERPPGVEFWQ